MKWIGWKIISTLLVDQHSDAHKWRRFFSFNNFYVTSHSYTASECYFTEFRKFLNFLSAYYYFSQFILKREWESRYIHNNKIICNTYFCLTHTSYTHSLRFIVRRTPVQQPNQKKSSRASCKKRQIIVLYLLFSWCYIKTVVFSQFFYCFIVDRVGNICLYSFLKLYNR